MGCRERLRSGFRPWLADHRSADGWQFRRYVRAAVEIVGPLNGSELVRIEVERYARAGVAYESATRAWAEAVNKRARGKGRRPNPRTIERLSRRMGLADGSLKEATARLEVL